MNPAARPPRATSFLRQLSERLPEPLARGREHRPAALPLPPLQPHARLVGERATHQLACAARPLPHLPRLDRLALSAGGAGHWTVVEPCRLELLQSVPSGGCRSWPQSRPSPIRTHSRYRGHDIPLDDGRDRRHGCRAFLDRGCGHSSWNCTRVCHLNLHRIVIADASALAIAVLDSYWRTPASDSRRRRSYPAYPLVLLADSPPRGHRPRRRQADGAAGRMARLAGRTAFVWSGSSARGFGCSCSAAHPVNASKFRKLGA